MFPEDDSAETPTTPTNGGPDIPHIPEPDYDMSDLETNNENGDTQSFSGSETGSWRDATATLRRNSKNTTERKKKKTVSFIMNEELANIIHSSGTMTKRDSILKDSTRERENADDLKSRGRTNKRSPTKVAPPMASEVSATEANNFSVSLDGISGAGCGKAVSHPAWEGGSIVEQSSPALSDSKLASSSKIRIEVGNKALGNGGSQTLPRSQSLHKSQSLSSELSPVTGQKLNKFHPKVETNSGGGGMISQADLQKAKQHLKSSRSFPELLEDGDNSSSGVSSDQDQDSVVISCEHLTKEKEASDYVTKLTVSSEQHQPIRDKNRGPATNQAKPGDTVTMTGPIGPVNIEWCGQAEEESHYQNYGAMMRQRRHRNLSR